MCNREVNKLDKNEAKFMMYDWDEGVFELLPTNNIVESIYTAWNYEFDLYEVETEDIVFSGRECNEANSEWLEPYGIRMIDGDRYRVLQDIKTGEVYEAEWQS